MGNPHQLEKAEKFRQLHHDAKLLILPNIWDPLGACLMQSLGFPAVATASAGIAFSQAIDDGEHMPFSEMVEHIRKIAASVTIPVTADIERGYAKSPQKIAENVRLIIRAGAVGINIEDSIFEGGDLLAIDQHCQTIQAIRQAADEEGIPVVINARIDTFLRSIGDSEKSRMQETLARASAYFQAGADCIYPIGLSDSAKIKRIIDDVKCPLNVYIAPGAPPLKKLEKIGVARVTTGPGLLKAALGSMRSISKDLMMYNGYEKLGENAIPSDEILKIISK